MAFIEGSGSRAYWEIKIGYTPNESSVGNAGLDLEFNRWAYRLRKKRFSEFSLSVVENPSDCRVLDAGSGIGFYLDCWQTAGVRELHALDFTLAACRHIESRFPSVTVHHADLADAQLDLGTGQFDVISCFDTLFHPV